VFHAGTVEISGVGGFESCDLPLLVRDQRSPIEAGALHRPTESSSILELVREAGCVDEQLLRHAAPDDTGAADPVFLGENDLGAVGGRDARSPDAARAAADDEEVDVLHVEPQIALIAGSAK
jgi:hypothetical protein